MKGISKVMAVLLIGAILATTIPLSIAATYDRPAAYAYAQKYWNKTCSDGYFFEIASPPTYVGPGEDIPCGLECGVDCAHFVSCCIGGEPNEHGGGVFLPSRYGGGVYGEPGAKRLADWLLASGQGIAEERAFTELEKGDVIVYTTPTGHHAVFYCGNGKVAAHSASLCCENPPSYEIYKSIHILRATKFDIGDTVRTTTCLNVRTEPKTTAPEIEHQNYHDCAPSGSTGVIIDGPESDDTDPDNLYAWWNISYDAGYTGWSAQNWLEKVPTPTTDWPMFQHDPKHTGFQEGTGQLATPSLLWSYSGAGYDSPPAVADINGDGKPEVVVGSYDYNVYALSGEDGSVLWKYKTGHCVSSAPAIADIDNDGKPEVVVTAYYDRNVYALNGEDGSVLWIYPTWDWILSSSPTIADVNNDGDLEVIVGCGINAGARVGVVYALNGENGSVLWEYEPEIYNAISWGFSATVADIDNDGKQEVVFGTTRGKIYALNGEDGSVSWTHETGGTVRSVAVADIDNDGTPEVVMGSTDNHVYALNGEDGTNLWGYETGQSVFGSPAVGDIDDDGKLEVVIGSEDNKVYALNGEDGSALWKYATGLWVQRSPAIADIDGDSKLEVVIGSADNKVYALNGEDGSALWIYPTGDRMYSSPAIADIDGDDKLEVVFGSSDGKVYALDEKHVNNPPVASFTCSPENPVIRQIITFDASGSTDADGTIVSYNGDFGDGSTWSRVKTTHSYFSKGSYTVKLTVTDNKGATTTTSKEVNVALPPFPSDGFDYPVGVPQSQGGTGYVTESNDGDGYYNAQDFGVWNADYNGYHLGEDWNGEGGGDTDFGDPVYAVSNGKVVYAQEAPGTLWGNVITVHHNLPDDSEVRSMYAHLKYGSLLVSEGDVVKRGQKIGEIGKGYNDATFSAHLHFEIRTDTSIELGPGYSSTPKPEGWVDPSEFIDADRPTGTPYKILPPTGVFASSLITGEDVAEIPQSVKQQIAVTKGVETPVADLVVHFDQATEDIDLSTLTADIDLTTRKSVIHMDSWPSEIEESKVFYIPSTGVGTVYICSGAKLLGEVNPKDATVWLNIGETKEGMILAATIYNEKEYYVVSGITGSGGGEAPKIISCDSEGNEREQFAPNESVYVKASGLEPSTNYKIWIQDDPVNESDILASEENPTSAETPKDVTTDSSGNLSVTLIWSIPEDVSETYHEYDIVFDKQGDGDNTSKYNAASDGIDSTSVAGFAAPIPELPTLILFSTGLIALAGYVLYTKKK
jgi:outer membrane protein assembly factor BamB/murein DD-endopeptidase MepM/ murein hydrolase activator NlpD